MSKFNFPKIKTVTIRNFSLYSREGVVSEINEVIEEGVYCLAGANGLGKTTFLNAINYGLTGIVLAPDKEVLSPQEIKKENFRFTRRYFAGRISEVDKDEAEIELLIKVNNKFYRIIRGFSEIDSLRYLEIYEKRGNKKITIIDTKNLSPNKLKENYETELAKDIGISSFEYYVFLQLYVLTFDENRRLIFWNDRASSHTLSISFNTSMDETEKLIDIRRLMDKHESNGRNSRWQATQINNKIRKLIETKEESIDLKELEKEYNHLIQLENDIELEFSNVNKEYDTFLKTQNSLHAHIMKLRMEHKKLFSIYSEPRSQLLDNTYIKMSIDKNACLICGAKGEQIIESIKKSLYKDHCPLCATRIRDEQDLAQNSLMAKIAKNDKNISESNHELEKMTLEAAGKKAELDKTEYERYEIQNKIAEFKRKNNIELLNNTKNDSLNLIIDKYKEQFNQFDQAAIESYKKRDKLRPSFNNLQEKITNAYKEAEIEFVPIFQKLAKSFIGYDLNITFETKNRSMKLILELKNTARTESSHLSESQRFFLDIALRMSLAIYLSNNDNTATMFIDTPEGSLDIAYESRVGEMFAKFVKEYEQHILMTANINASQLLLSLADKCRSERMQFRRMIEWTDLSIIQKEGEKLFQQVFLNIETTLHGNQ